MPTPKKAETMEVIKQRFAEAKSIIFTDFSGLSVEQISNFRRKLREQDTEYRIYKNTLTRIAIKDEPYAEMVSPHLEGTTAVMLAGSDPIAPLKILKEFERTRKIPVKVGVIDGVAYGLTELNVLRELPGRDQMRGMLLGMLQAPARNLVSLLSAPSRNLVSVLKQKADKDAA